MPAPSRRRRRRDKSLGRAGSSAATTSSTGASSSAASTAATPPACGCACGTCGDPWVVAARRAGAPVLVYVVCLLVMTAAAAAAASPSQPWQATAGTAAAVPIPALALSLSGTRVPRGVAVPTLAALTAAGAALVAWQAAKVVRTAAEHPTLWVELLSLGTAGVGLEVYAAALQGAAFAATPVALLLIDCWRSPAR